MGPTDQLDARADAVDHCARFDLALDLLRRPDSSDHLQRSIAMIEEASEAGHARASELCAVFEAMGVARPQSWDRAFDRLQKAAEQGSPFAQRQLLILACTDDRRDDWTAVRSRISLEELLAPGERTPLSEAPRIRVIEGFATPAECAWLIDRARSRLEPATIIDSAGERKIDPGRSNSGAEFLVPDMDLVLEVIRHRIAGAIHVPVPVFEPTQILHYSVGQEFKPHHDFLDPANPAYRQQLTHGQRIATFLVYLNEGFEGGETRFLDVGINYRGKTGDALYWANVDREGRPEPLTRHAGLPPTSGEKWILSQWIRDRTAPRS